MNCIMYRWMSWDSDTLYVHQNVAMWVRYYFVHQYIVWRLVKYICCIDKLLCISLTAYDDNSIRSVHELVRFQLEFDNHFNCIVTVWLMCYFSPVIWWWFDGTWSGALFGALMVDCEFIAVASVCVDVRVCRWCWRDVVNVDWCRQWWKFDTTSVNVMVISGR